MNPLLRFVKHKLESAKVSFNNPLDRAVKYINALSNASVLDVGANIGQFGIDLKFRGYGGQIFSYEPVPQFHKILEITAQKYSEWQTFGYALGAFEQQNVEINVSNNEGMSSSFLLLNDIHLFNFPESRSDRKVVTRITTVDSEIEILKINPEHMMLKIDVQGFELEVLKGSSKHLSEIPFCLVELSLQPLYKGAPGFLEVASVLADFGHTIIDIRNGVRTKSGELLQIDVLTSNNKYLSTLAP